MCTYLHGLYNYRHIYFSHWYIIHLSAEKVTMRGLLKELTSVVRWYEFGVQLDIPTSELDKIQLDYTRVEQCKMQMLIMWQDLKEGSWSDI